MCTNLAQDPLTSSCLSRFDDTCNPTQTFYRKKLHQSSKLQHSFRCEDVDAFELCVYMSLCIMLLTVYARTGVTHELVLIADGNAVTGVVDFVSNFLGRSSALLSPSRYINSSQCSPDPLSPPRIVRIVAQ